jgi:O-methyltransferase
MTAYQGCGRARLVQRYLNLLEASLTGILLEDTPCDFWSGGAFDPNRRLLGRDWPSLAFSMIGSVRMRNLRHASETVLLDGVEGDFIETGVWRGGACILMSGILEAYGDDTRRVFVADSFAGLPPPNSESFPADADSQFHTHTQLQISRADVEDNFRRFGLLDGRVIFLEGWFKDTLPDAPIDQLAVLRLDGDMYESTIEAMDALYHKVSYGGFVIVDDYFLPPCAKAVHDFRERYGITSPILPIDGMGTYWRVDHKPIR